MPGRAEPRPGARRCPAGPSDAGAAIIEVVTLGVLLLVPLVYLVVALGRIQAGSMAAQSAAAAGTRALTTADTTRQGEERAAEAVRIAVADQGFAPRDVTVRTTCAATNCLTPGSRVEMVVRVTVVLPGVPDVVSGAVPLQVTVQAQRVVRVDRFRAAPVA